MFEQILSTFLTGLIIAAVTILGKAAKDLLTAQKKKAEEETNNEVLASTLTVLEAGVAKTEKEFVQSVKAAAEDGKLTKDEMKQAEDIARKNAIEIGAEIAPKAADLIVQVSNNVLSGLIKMVLSKQKQAE